MTQFRNGDRVLGRWDFFWYPAMVRGEGLDGVPVRYDDGTEAMMAPALVLPLDLRVGERVFGRWQGGDTYYPGVITDLVGAKVDIRYDDGERESTTLGMIRVVRGDRGRAWAPGDRVLAQWIGEPFFYPGVVTTVDQEIFVSVRFQDGDQAINTPDQVLPLEVHVGDRVQARWQQGPDYHPGTIHSRAGEDLVIRYDDGAEEATKITFIRVLPEEAAVGRRPQEDATPASEGSRRLDDLEFTLKKY